TSPVPTCLRRAGPADSCDAWRLDHSLRGSSHLLVSIGGCMLAELATSDDLVRLQDLATTRSETSMSDDFKPGLEGVIAFETEIAEQDKDGGALRYRGVDIEDLVGKVTFGNVWALLVDGTSGPGLPAPDPFPIPVHTGDVRVDVQAALAMLAPIWGYRPLLDISDGEARAQLARAAVMALSYVAQSARGVGVPAVPQSRIDQGKTIIERFMPRWRGDPDPQHIKAVDAYFVSAAEHGMNASTFT